MCHKRTIVFASRRVKKKSIQILTTLVSVTLAAASSADKVPFQWPNSRDYWRMLVNVNQYAERYVKENPRWFAQDKVVTDLEILDIPAGGRGQAIKRFKGVRTFLQSRGMSVGTYVSGSTVGPEWMQTHYPNWGVSIERMPPNTRYVGSWPGERDRKIVDLSDTESRRALQAGIRRIWEGEPAPIRFVDNIPPHPAVLRMQPWSASCKHMAELRELGESLGARVIFNIPMSVSELSDEDTRELIKAVGGGGISLEMPWTDVIRNSKEATARAKQRYRQLLDGGMGIILIPVNTPEDLLTAWVRTWRKPTDHLYISTPFWKAPDMRVVRLQ